MSFLLILGAGLLGVIGHWVTRWAQGRTQSTFFEYLMAYKARTLSSLFSTLTSASLIYQTAPVDSNLMMLLITSYTTSYMLDSTVNKDKDPEPPVIVRGVKKTIKEFEHEDKNKSLDDLLDDDSRL